MPTLCPSAELMVHVSELMAHPAHWRAVRDDNDDAEQIVTQFIGRLGRLEGVPFPYLVPDGAMLPPESIRFFYLDQNWLDALTDGALSLGRIGDQALQHDQALVPVLRRRAETTVLGHRRRRLAVPPRDAPTATPRYTGFLMRSAVVLGWPGLEVRATAAASGTGANTQCTGDAIEMIRMDRLSPEVLICLFADRVGCVQIHEPKEGVNVGATLTTAAGSATYSKTLRGLGIGGYAVGTFIDGAEVEVPLRDASTRVVEVNQLRLRMVETLGALTPPAWTGTAADFTSAQFSLQMVEGAGQQIFRAIDAPQPQPQRAARPRLEDQHAADRAALDRFLFGPEEEDTP